MATQWYYAQNNQQFGPVPVEQLRSLYLTGALRSTDLVWSEGLSAWTPAGQVPALQMTPVQNPPARSPVPTYVPHAAAAGQPAGVSEEVVKLLRSTKPWVRFLSVLGFIGLALLVLGCVAILVIPIGGPMGSMSFGPRIGVSFAYFLMGLLQFPGVLFLSRYANRISRLSNSGHPTDLEAALRAQKSFWKYMGILTLVMLILYILIIVGVIVFAGATFLGHR